MEIDGLKERLLWDFIQKRPIMCGVKITSKCNLKCLHCPFHNDSRPDLNTEDWIKIFEKLEKIGVVLLNLEGGEPFLRPDLQKLVRYLVKHFYTGVTTNGSYPIDIKSDIVWVSVDGLSTTHNKIRGKGVFETLLVNVKNSDHPNIHANTTINRLNYKEIPKLVRDYQDIFKGFSIEYHYPYPGTEYLDICAEKRRKVTSKLINMKKQGFPIDNSVKGLKAMGSLTWGERCQQWAHMNVDPDGTLINGCYIRESLGPKSCSRCGYHCYCELSLALEGEEEVIDSLSKLVGLEF